MIQRRSEQRAAVWSKDGVVRYAIRNRGFPFVAVSSRDRLPQTSQAFRAASYHKQGFTEFAETHPMAWTNTSDTSLFEQTRLTANGHAVTLLWAGAVDDSDEDEDLLPELRAPDFRLRSECAPGNFPVAHVDFPVCGAAFPVRHQRIPCS